MLPLRKKIAIVTVLLSFTATAPAQQITGVWQGRIDKKRVEVKIIQKGDSLTGTSYYYNSGKDFTRYSIRGYFDPGENSVVWWDDMLLDEQGNSHPKMPLLSVADFNCPGSGKMFLQGNTNHRDEQTVKRGTVSLTKIRETSFPDEWDFVLDHYTTGGNDPDIIDSINLIAFIKQPRETSVEKRQREKPAPVAKSGKPQMVFIPPPPSPIPAPDEPVIAQKPLTIEEKFTGRNKILTREIPVEGEFVELRFYDNAEIDGDSISLFLNNNLIFQHIRLTDKPYTIKLAVSELNETNELVMVAENLGAIPPNTSYMVAIVGSNRYEAQLASTENSSAMIRLNKK